MIFRKMLIKRNEPLAEHTTFKIGGKAAFFAEPDNLCEVKELISQAREKNRPFFILGAESFTKEKLIEKIRKDKNFRKIWARQIAFFNAEMGLRK